LPAATPRARPPTSPRAGCPTCPPSWAGRAAPLLARNLAYQLARQGTDTAQADDYGHKLATLAVHPRLADTGPADVITHTLAVAEFLARESRSGNTREH
jgi:hypothetical protein